MVLEVFFNKSISNYYEIDDTITLVLTEDIDNLRFIKSKMEQINEILIASGDERNINQIKQLFDYNKKLIVNSDCVSHQMLLKLKEMFGNNFYVKSKYNEHEDVLVDEYLKTIDKLLGAFETEMNILHKLSYDDIEPVVGEKIADNIEAARKGKMKINAGGGGVYGKVTKE